MQSAHKYPWLICTFWSALWTQSHRCHCGATGVSRALWHLDAYCGAQSRTGKAGTRSEVRSGSGRWWTSGVHRFQWGGVCVPGVPGSSRTRSARCCWPEGKKTQRHTHLNPFTFRTNVTQNNVNTHLRHKWTCLSVLNICLWRNKIMLGFRKRKATFFKCYNCPKVSGIFSI